MESIVHASSVREVHVAHHKAVSILCLLQSKRQNDNNHSNRHDEIVAQLDAARDSALAKLQVSAGEKAMDDAQEIFPRLYLGPFSVARDLNRLKAMGITHIVCLSAEGPSKPHSSIQYLYHPLVEAQCTLEDGAKQLAEVLPSSFSFTKRALATNDTTRVLIHCLHGKTRSAAIASCVVALLSTDTKYDFHSGYEQVRRVRDVLVPEEWHADLQKAVDSTRSMMMEEKDQMV